MELLENCSVLGNSPFPGDLEPGHTIKELELLEMRPGTDWYQLPSSSSSSSSPAACHLADAVLPMAWVCPSTVVHDMAVNCHIAFKMTEHTNHIACGHFLVCTEGAHDP